MSGAEPKLQAALDVLFDPEWYAARYSDRLAPGEAALEHLLSVGLPQQLNPHPLFDAAWYAAQHNLSDAGQAFAHFVLVGEHLGLAPGPYFDVAWYRAVNPDVAAAGVNSLVHYVEFGRLEGRLPSPIFDPETPTSEPGVWVLEENSTNDPRWILPFAPRPTTLARLMAAQEATSFLDPNAARQLVVRTHPAPAGRIVDAVVMGGSRAVFLTTNAGALSAPGAKKGWALTHVTHAVAPPILSGVHLLGLGAPPDAAQLERWADGVRNSGRDGAAPYLLIDETLPELASARLLFAAGQGSAAYRVPPRRLMAVQHLTTLDLG